MEQKLSFVKCGNHKSTYGEIYFMEPGKYQCRQCSKEFTHKEIINLIWTDFSEARQKLEDQYLRDLSELHKLNTGEQ